MKSVLWMGPEQGAPNLRKRGVRFSEAVGVFSDDAAITIKDDDIDTGEELPGRQHPHHLSSDGRTV